ncbi:MULTISPECIES: UDP-glucose 4-epimerase [unclassified Caballeronia]|uniref:UDP-glucose 4-epimerase n=1 Tax=unclassified Caballeronia TaxID=2646786 RepID=UPI002864638D|nr:MULTISPECIES: UDP-glucose 4-epimerase [unclassified Caballeronia]MDR5777643.1 UDP-glucose 4-epimerase [Caballeronia sp. LZ002]MDR5798567.1 UDP-glucose 4-epimerase [Caballeronia sp. LZ001]MDR5853080.1 UDP-glucose 4-epimerase [Caballeronia sp. LZ003]
MSLKGQVDDTDWSITCNTEQVTEGIVCSIGVEQHDAERGRFVHRFRHARIFDNEYEAVLAGLSEGMTWIRLRASGTIDV